MCWFWPRCWEASRRWAPTSSITNNPGMDAEIISCSHVHLEANPPRSIRSKGPFQGPEQGPKASG